MLDKAIKIAIDAHAGQVDKGGKPYILHPLRLMMKFSHERLQIIAVLHDVIEDSSVTIRDLNFAGFESEIVEAVVALTRTKENNYNQYMTLIKWNVLAKQVKIEDIKDNLQVTRLKSFGDADAKRVSKYISALEYLRAE